MVESLIKKLINIWDPLGIYGFAPKDEYDDIVRCIIDLFYSNANEKDIKKYLLSQCYNEKTASKSKINDLYELICLFISRDLIGGQ